MSLNCPGSPDLTDGGSRMNTLLTLVLLLGVRAPAAPEPAAAGPIRYQVRFVDCEGLGWRASVQCRLSFCGHVGGSTAWIADESAVSALFDHVVADPADRIVAAPAVTSEPGTPATIQSSTTRNLVVHAGGPGGPLAGAARGRTRRADHRGRRRRDPADGRRPARPDGHPPGGRGHRLAVRSGPRGPDPADGPAAARVSRSSRSRRSAAASSAASGPSRPARRWS